MLLRHKQKLHASFEGDDDAARRGSIKKSKTTDTPKDSAPAPRKSQNQPLQARSVPSSSGSGSGPSSGSGAGGSGTAGSGTSSGGGGDGSPNTQAGQNAQNANSQVPSQMYMTDANGNGGNNHPYSNLLKNQLHLRHRHASFSATSATSYTKNKDIAALNSQELYPVAPPQVGFSTPQMLATNMDDSAIDDFFGISDPLFINPQLLDGSESTDSIFKFTANTNKDQHQQPPQNQPPQHQQQQPPQPQPQQQQQQPQQQYSPDHSHLIPQSHSVQLKPQMPPEFHLWDTNANLPFNAPSHPRTSVSSAAGGPPGGAGSSFSPTPSLSAVPPHVISPHPSHLSGTSECGSSPGLDYPDSSSSADPHAFMAGGNDWGRSHPHNSTMVGNGTGLLHQLHTDPLAILNSSLDEKNASSKSLASPTLNLSNIHLSDNYHHQNHHPQQPPPPPQHQQNQPHIITPQLRMHVLTLLSAPTPFSLSQTPQLPSASDLQRYIDAYYTYFGRHLPFLHHSLAFTSDNVPLALGMAAIGALYLFEPQTSMSIFEISRSCIHIYLESRRERRVVLNNASATPLWLVQALILGVIYGLFSSETLVNEIAVAQANAVVSLAKSAGLQFPVDQYVDSSLSNSDNIEAKWTVFIDAQSRIRTMHVVHIISCLLATSHNISSSLRNSEILCGCPCDESLWNASTAPEWWDLILKKDLTKVQITGSGLSFTDCLGQLLSGSTLVEKVSQFTLLSLMYGLHLDILEKRRNCTGGNSWPAEKAHLESVLQSWETTWSLSPLASLSPSSQYGPIMSDAIPLSSLAHVRIYVDLRKAKEAFWKRDFVAMNHEIDMVPTDQGLFDAASFAADAISLWEKHAVKWTLEATATQTFIHTLVALFDCAIAVSEFLRRSADASLSENESLLVNRIGKILYRVLDIVGYSDEEYQPLNEDGSVKDPSRSLCTIALHAVARILSVKYLWPYALVLSDALICRSKHLG